MPVTRLSAGQTIIPRHSTHCKRVVRPCIVSFNRRSRRSRRRRRPLRRCRIRAIISSKLFRPRPQVLRRTKQMGYSRQHLSLYFSHRT